MRFPKRSQSRCWDKKGALGEGGVEMLGREGVISAGVVAGPLGGSRRVGREGGRKGWGEREKWRRKDGG